VRRDTTVPVAAVSCDTVTAVGGVCGNGNVVLAGESLSGRALYTTTAQFPATTWNNGQTTTASMIRTNILSGINGASNTATLAVADADTTTGTQNHMASKICQDMIYGGYSDWHLPAAYETVELFRNRALLPAGIRAGTIWTATEVDQSTASTFRIDTGLLTTVTKSGSQPVQCVRLGASTLALKSCDTVTSLGETCGTGKVVYAGKAPSGGDLFTTSFLLPVTSWNNSQATTASMIRTNVLSSIIGASNTASLALLDGDTTTGTQIHSAAEVCENMTYGGYADWYLPAASEARTLFLNRASLPVSSGTVWSSSEVVQTTARSFNIGTGALASIAKSTSYSLLCVRRSVVPGLTPPDNCTSATTNGAACAGGSVLYVGTNGSGERVYTTAFQFPSAFWNSGNTTTSIMITTSRTSQTDGAGNTAALAVADADTTTGTQVHNAASICDQLNIGGSSDWYLPAISEAEFLYANRAGLPTIGLIWSSTEAAQTTAISLTALGARSTVSKATEMSVQCIRKGDVATPAPTVVLNDGFETFSGWVQRGNGVVTQDMTQARSGSASALKSAFGDANGAYKMLDFPVIPRVLRKPNLTS